MRPSSSRGAAEPSTELARQVQQARQPQLPARLRRLLGGESCDRRSWSWGGEFNRQQRHGIAYRAASAPPAAFPVAVGGA